MAAMSAATAGTATLTPPSSSHGNQGAWSYSASSHSENVPNEKKVDPIYDSGIGMGVTRKMSSGEHVSMAKGGKAIEMGFLSPPYGSESTARNGDGQSDAALPKTGPAGDKRTAAEVYAGIDDENSKWIHRDKLARIENEELQAAGIILPRPRATSRPRANKSTEKLNGFKRTAPTIDMAELTPTAQSAQGSVRSRKNSVAAERKVQDIEIPSWDLRTPEEIVAEANDSYWTSNGGARGVSKIPVAKVSPLPIPVDFIERDSPSTRRQSDMSDENNIAYPKPRARSRSGSMKALENVSSNTLQQPRRSATDTSPKKPTGPAARKTSAPAKGAPAGARPRTRGGPNKDSTSSSGTRPSTRSGELSPGPGGSGKQPEGDPPWMVSAYKPDPRLPPDQQLLPTVARRLQQEKWQREGKFGNVYDKEFRPLTDDGFPNPPLAAADPGPSTEPETTAGPVDAEWPLKTEQKSPSSLKAPKAYSTMPKISDKPPVSPLASPGLVLQHHNLSQQQVAKPAPAQEELPKKEGCGCCVVM